VSWSDFKIRIYSEAYVLMGNCTSTPAPRVRKERRRKQRKGRKKSKSSHSSSRVGRQRQQRPVSMRAGQISTIHTRVVKKDGCQKPGSYTESVTIVTNSGERHASLIKKRRTPSPPQIVKALARRNSLRASFIIGGGKGKGDDIDTWKDENRTSHLVSRSSTENCSSTEDNNLTSCWTEIPSLESDLDWSLEILDDMHCLGVGEFGSVDCVRRRDTSDCYALKKISKGVYYDRGIIPSLLNEKLCLMAVDHSFIIQLYATLQDKHFCYFVLEHVSGAEFYDHLTKYLKFPINWAKFYCANVVLAIGHLHSKGIVYRDIKPENLLLDKSGYIKVIDLGFCKFIHGARTHTYCGTIDYLAPEVVNEEGHSYPYDWWCLGVLTYEMVIGRAPFRSDNANETFKKIIAGKVKFPRWIPKEYAATKKLIRKFMKLNPGKRLGVNELGVKAGLDDIKNHSWFSCIDWKALEAKKMTPPYVPKGTIPTPPTNKMFCKKLDPEHNCLFEGF